MREYLKVRGFTRAGNGCYSVCYSRPDINFVIKIIKAKFFFPEIDCSCPKMRQIFHVPIWQSTDRRVCIAPKAYLAEEREDEFGGNEYVAAISRKIEARAKKLGIVVGDVAYGNVGRIDGRWKIIDYGCLNCQDSDLDGYS